eukprot:2584494-Prymnesium_polylepis.1
MARARARAWWMRGGSAKIAKLRTRVERPKYGNWRLQGAEHAVPVGESIDAPQNGPRVLPPEPPSVAYQMMPNVPTPKTTLSLTVSNYRPELE